MSHGSSGAAYTYSHIHKHLLFMESNFWLKTMSTNYSHCHLMPFDAKREMATHIFECLFVAMSLSRYVRFNYHPILFWSFFMRKHYGWIAQSNIVEFLEIRSEIQIMHFTHCVCCLFFHFIMRFSISNMSKLYLMFFIQFVLIAFN